MAECQTFYSPDGIRVKTTAVVIGLLWSTGLRPSEPLNLISADIDLEHGILHIRKAKFSKERYVPIDDLVRKKLIHYKSWIGQKIGIRSPEDAFFYTTNGKPLTKGSLSNAFE